jgi:drug/metabolite transporter (DMT)-like permease
METQIGPAVMTPNAYLLVIVGAAWLAYYMVLSKREVNAWVGRNATFAAIYMLMTAIPLFVLSYMTGGPQIAAGLPWQESFWFAAIVTGVLGVNFQFCSTRAK